MTVDFNDYFWGEKYNGYEVLYQNMKNGLSASKELSDFLRERSSIEETNSKLVSKLAKQVGCGSIGTFAPVWDVAKLSAERLSQLHLEMVQKITELVKDVNKYADELHRKHKTVKEEESGTVDIVQVMQTTSQSLQKAKESYTSKALELERLRKDNASLKDIEKAEIKLKKTCEDYKLIMEKYVPIKKDFEKKMTIACRHFQEVEETHLKRMKDFLMSYAELVQSNHESIGKVHSEFKRKCIELTVDKLLEQFVLKKYTGLEKPSSMEIEHLNMTMPGSTLITNDSIVLDKSSAGAGGGVANGMTAAGVPENPTGIKPPKKEGFLKSRRDKAKSKKAKKKKDAETSSKEDKSDNDEKEESEKKAESATPEVDEDGFCIRPKLERWENDKGSFYSSSDMDSDEEREHKLHVEIKPLSNGSAPMSASVDELRATVENLSLSPLGTLPGRRSSTAEHENNMKRSQSVSQQIGLAQSKVGNELLGLSFCTSPSASGGGSTGSTPTSHHHSHPYAPLQSPSMQVGTVHSPTMGSSNNRYADLGDIFSEVGEITGGNTGTLKLGRQTATPVSNSTSNIALPRPPSRRSEAATRGRVSPSNMNMSRTDSLSSVGGTGVEFRASFGSSRGPSPLTIGMADTIPLAVAFHEIVHAYFRGTDETKCKVKMSGDMMLSFPSGIVNVFANNPSPAKLWFRIRNSQKLENILPNNQLVSIDPLQSTPDNIILEFNMPALTALLRRQSEQNPTASYFNVDILKYQIKTKPGAGSCPFQLVSYWKCEQTHTDLKIDYKYNLHAMSSPSPLLNVTIAVPVDGGVRDLHSMPSASWLPESNSCMWKFTELSQHSENKGVGSLRARLEITAGPSTPATIRTQFNCEGTTLSGMEFELVGSGYRLSLVKRRFVSGKYICDGDKHANTTSSAPVSPPVRSPDSTTSPRNASAAS